MNKQIINQKALASLSKQKWKTAQQLFYYNAKKNPSHETYNNLGYFLITEGLLCKNGKTRNALKLGMHYLLKAHQFSTSAINSCAIVKAIDYQLQIATKNEKNDLCIRACNHLKSALLIENSFEIQYNMLRFLYFRDCQNEEIIVQARELVEKFTCVESVNLYFELLSANHLCNRGLECIEKYGDFLDEATLLMFYAKCGLFEKGYDLCELVCRVYSLDEFISAAIIECCIATNHFIEAQKYTEVIKIFNNNANHFHKKNERTSMLYNLLNSTDYRRKILDSYHPSPPLIESCCYFGCKMHHTESI